jgi:hypothetical protein
MVYLVPVFPPLDAPPPVLCSAARRKRRAGWINNVKKGLDF